MVATVILPSLFIRKNDGTPIIAASEKQINWRLVKLKYTLDFTFEKSLGALI